jgi:hypothetical protein
LKNGKQHTTEEANESRFVTKNRWVVEAVNGVIKRWTYFNNVVSNINIPHIEEDFRIVCSLINKFRPSRAKNEPNDENTAALMRERNVKKNMLMSRVEKLKRKRTSNISTNIDSLNFPKLSNEDLKDLTLGVYQLKQARSYTREHLNEEGLYEFEFIPEESDLIKIKINSRHLSQTVYTVFIELNKSNDKNSKKENSPIKSYYCDCKNGSRTVGCCAHITSVLWYLGIAKNNSKLLKPIFSTYLSSYCKDSSKN